MKIAFPITRLRIDSWFLIAAGLTTLLLSLGLLLSNTESSPWLWVPILAGSLLLTYGICMRYFHRLREHVYDFMLGTGLLSVAILLFIGWNKPQFDLFFPILISLHVINSLLTRHVPFYIGYSLGLSIVLLLGTFLGEGWSIQGSISWAIWGLMVLIMGYFHVWRVQVGKEKNLHFHLFQEMLDQSSRAMFLIDMKQNELLSINHPGLDLLRQLGLPQQSSGERLLTHLGFHLKYLDKRFIEAGNDWEEKSFYKIQSKEKAFLELEIVLKKLAWEGVAYLLLRIQDVTGLRAKERDLERTLAFNQSLVNSIPDMLISLNAQQAIGSIQLPGDSLGEELLDFQGREFSDVLDYLSIPAAKQDQIMEGLKTLHTTGHAAEITFLGKLQEKDYYVDLRMLSLGVQGEVLCMFRDISAQHQKEQALQTSESRYKTLVDNMNEGLVMTDPKEKILFVNQRMADILGREAHSLIGAQTVDVFDGPEAAREIASRTQRRKEGITEEYELIISTENGTSKHLLVAAAPYLDSQDKFLGSIAVITDITDRKLTEKKLEEKKSELDAFMYKASHDLKGPLASIIGVSNIAQQEIGSGDAIRYFQLITKSAKRLDLILSELINLTRLNNANLQLEPIQLNRLTQDIIDSLAHLDKAKRVQYQIELHHKEEFVSDPQLLLSILQNLIYNAIQYQDTEKDPPSISVLTQDSAQGLQLWVKDNGIGIPDRLQKRVFEMFYRGNTQSKGSGLGLYIVKTAVEKLNGHVQLTSTEGKGTEFRIHLPRLES